LNAKQHGVPQNRERVFLIGIRDDSDNDFQFPKEEHLSKRLKDVLEEGVDDKYFLSDKMVNVLAHHKNPIIENETPNKSACIHAGYFKMGGRDQQYLKVKSGTAKGYDEATEGDSINFGFASSETRRGRVGKGVAQTLDTGCNQGVMIKELSKYQGDKVTQYNNQIHPCLAANGGNKLKGIGIQDNNYKIRRLTPRECFRLMDFPDTFTWPVSDSQAYKQAGNSIVVNVLYKIIKNLIK